MVFSALFLCVAAVECFFLLGQDYLLGTRQRAALETALRQSYIDLQTTRKRLESARAVLVAAIDEAEKQRAQLQDAERAFQQSQKILPNLIHTLGTRGDGMRFRAAISKRLPPKPEPAQGLLWSCQNFLDVWAGDIETARQMAARQFPGKQQYAIGEFAATAPKDTSGDAPPRQQEKAA